MQQYMKLIAAAALAVVTLIISAVTDGHVTPGEWVLIAAGVANAVNTFIVPNVPSGIGSVAKLLVVLVGAITAALTDQVLLGGLSQQEIMTVALLGVQAVLVYLARNAPPAPAVSRRGQLER